ncbi:MAG TPA: GntR family transcriptional regulator [Acetobacteraceae bacterium]|jgi:DNA-binding GntR family transcriptional regulator|nr:GntR family transcriptional regulator [Acetobacteraceae bacterium]
MAGGGLTSLRSGAKGRRDPPQVSPPPGTSARTVKLTEVVAAIEEDIALGQLHPRERLIEEELMERFHVKRHVARQALVELHRMGLIERIPNRGAVVRSYTREAVEQLYALRELLEPEAARLIPLPPGRRDLAEIKRLQASHDLAVQRNDFAGMFRANIAFHRCLFRLCNNVFLSDAIAAASLRAHGIRFFALVGPFDRERAREDHHAIVAALERGDRDALVRLCRDHLRPSKEAYLRAYVT